MKPPRKKTDTAAGPSIIDWPEVNRVLDFMGQHGLEEFEFAQGDVRIHLRKPGSSSAAVIPFVAPSSPTVVPPPAAGGTVAPAPAATSDAGKAEEGLHTVKSPIVGTFYLGPNPGAPPFVKVGGQVAVGQVLCIVEAMKLMNEIESDVAGELVQALVQNGEPVEYGQALFTIRLGKSS